VGLVEIWSLGALGDLELGLGHLDEARARYEAVLRALETRGVADADLSPRPELVEVELGRGRRPQAELHLATFEREAMDKGQPWARARAERCRGLLGRDDDVDRHFAEALDLHGQTPDAFETARTRLAYGERLRRMRRRVRAREELRGAMEVFDRLGASPWSGRAARELAATGETARRRDPSTWNQLTPQELQIAVLLGSGRTTREAAAAMFLSPKTIEYHLRSVYRKLGVRSRDELATAIDGHVPEPGD